MALVLKPGMPAVLLLSDWLSPALPQQFTISVVQGSLKGTSKRLISIILQPMFQQLLKHLLPPVNCM